MYDNNKAACLWQVNKASLFAKEDLKSKNSEDFCLSFENQQYSNGGRSSTPVKSDGGREREDFNQQQDAGEQARSQEERSALVVLISLCSSGA